MREDIPVTETHTLEETMMMIDGSQITVTYDPAVADPNTVDGSYVWVGTVSEVEVDGFDFTPANGEPTWSIMTAEIDRGYVAIDPKQVA